MENISPEEWAEREGYLPREREPETPEEIDAFLRAEGLDPDKIAERGVKFIREKMRERDLCIEKLAQRDAEEEADALNALRIWKFELSLGDEQIIEMPSGAKILCVQPQRDRICLWAEVHPCEPVTPRTFCVFGTGQPIERRGGLAYLGTVQLSGFVQIYDLVVHVFEQVVPPASRPSGDPA